MPDPCESDFLPFLGVDCFKSCDTDWQVSRKLGLLYSEMIFVQGYVHCDPHPGNILISQTPQGVQITLLDHGLYQVIARII